MHTQDSAAFGHAYASEAPEVMNVSACTLSKFQQYYLDSHQNSGECLFEMRSQGLNNK